MKSKLILLFISLLFFNAAYLFELFFKPTPEEYISKFQEKLYEKERLLGDELDRLDNIINKTKSYQSLFLEELPRLKKLADEKGLAILLYDNDSLKFWTTNAIPFENTLKDVGLDDGIVKLKNGWYKVLKPNHSPVNTKSLIGLILIKYQYPYQNNYLQNNFYKDFELPAGVIINLIQQANSHAIKDRSGNYMFSLQFFGSSSYSVFALYLILLFNILGVYTFFIWYKSFITDLKPKLGNNFTVLLFSLVFILLRYWSIRFSFPSLFYNFNLFSPSVYADANSIWLNSLGDLLINLIVLFVIGYNFNKKFSYESNFEKLSKLQKRSIISFLLFFFLIVWQLVAYTILSLINNSNISFEINNILSLDIYSYVALTMMGILLMFSFFASETVRKIIYNIQLPKRELFFIVVFVSGLYFISAFIGLNTDVYSCIFPVVLIILLLFYLEKQTSYSFTVIVAMVVAYSLYTESIISDYSNKKEFASRKLLAEKIADEQDPVAEFLFNEVAEKILNDTLLVNYINGNKKQPVEFERRLQEVYFSGYWEKYDVRISFYDNNFTALIKHQNLGYDSHVYFDQLIYEKSLPTSNRFLHFINNASSGKVSYIVRIPIKDLINNKKIGTLYIELDAKLVSNEIGYPLLLLDKKLAPDNEFAVYSYAKYKNHQLVNQYGKYFYSNNDAYFNSNEMGFSGEDKDAYDHLFYRPNKSTLIVVSKKDDGVYGKVTVFSYLFTFFSLLLLILFLLYQLSTGGLNSNLSFKYRIQLLLVSIILTSLILFGIGTVYYIQKQFRAQNKDKISEKLKSVLLDVEYKLGGDSELSKSVTEYVSYLLKKSANVFFTDINLYDAEGNLYASSRNRIFESGLISKKMNTTAFLNMAVFGKREYVHDEKIGDSEYLSAYVPFKNKEGKKLGYVNLPYFAKQNDLEKEISVYVVALINIYVLLFVLSVVVAIVISNYVTQPLKLIQDKLAKVKLGRFNEPIEWSQQDEIGNLVAEYNRMIFELMQSADLLAKSERESAWREMAKQVAHEIKNPLTPMKLSIQHLQRLHNDNSPDFDEKVTQLSQMLIEQIDMLSNIANEFSSFAKMPKPNLQRVLLNELISSSIALFEETQNIKISYTSTVNDAFAMADKEELLRVFNNLIKNATQSITSDKLGLIDIRLIKDKGCYVVSVKDNGEGIKAENADKIFVPNFTTKTGGSGLGLAIVKNIVDSFEGKIWFESNEKQGVTFYVSFPVA